MKKNGRFRSLLLFFALALVIPGMLLISAGESRDKASTKKAVKRGAEVIKVKGHARAWSQADKTPLSQREGARKMKPVLNMEKHRKIVKSDDAADPVAQTEEGKPLSRTSSSLLDPRGGPLAVDDPIIDFAGLDLNNWGAGWPPDTVGDVGINHYVQAVNTSIGIYNKSTGAQVSATTFDSFFGGTGISGTPCDSNNNGDPIVVYDQYSSRWFIMDFAWYPSQVGGTYFSIAVSNTSDPTGTWTQYALQADPTLLADYPKVGVWHDGIYITANMFTFSGTFQHVKIWALNKADLYSGTLTAQSFTDSSYYAWSILPSNAKGETPPSSSAPNYMIAMDANEFGGISADQLVMWELDVDWVTPANTTWTGPTLLPTASFGLTASGVPQPSPGTTLDSLFGRLMNPAMYRKFSTHESMYVNHVAQFGGRRVERWYEVRINSGTPSIYQQGTYAPGSNHFWMGSIGGDEDGNVAMGFSVSSSTTKPAIHYTAQASINGTSGVMGLGEKSIIDGTGVQTTYSRWGDYSAISIDPTDDKTFWYTTEYYVSNGTNWQTRIGAFKVKPDLWSQDRPDDIGLEPNTISSHFWQSEDIWVRNTNDGFVNQVHQNPEYGQTNYLYVRIRNRSAEGSGINKVYWAFPGTGLAWPASWNQISTQQPTGNMVVGNIVILEYPWNPPNPGTYGSSHFCLLSRIETAPFPPWGMEFAEVTSINTNVRNNNNIVWKNITIVDNILNMIPKESIISMGNLTREDVTTRLEIVAVEQNDPEQPEGKRTILDWGAVAVVLDAEVADRWLTKGARGTGIKADEDDKDTVNVLDKKALLDGIDLKAGEEFLVKFRFSPKEDSLNDKREYIVDVIQHDLNPKTGEFEEVGGVRFVLRHKPDAEAEQNTTNEK
jgi:hypothetical protein